MKTQAEELNRYLEENKMTQAELSLRIDMSKKHINQVCKWYKKISLAMSMKLHYVFWVDLFYFSNLPFKKNNEKI